MSQITRQLLLSDTSTLRSAGTKLINNMHYELPDSDPRKSFQLPVVCCAVETCESSFETSDSTSVASWSPLTQLPVTPESRVSLHNAVSVLGLLLADTELVLWLGFVWSFAPSGTRAVLPLLHCDASLSSGISKTSVSLLSLSERS